MMTLKHFMSKSVSDVCIMRNLFDIREQEDNILTGQNILQKISNTLCHTQFPKQVQAYQLF